MLVKSQTAWVTPFDGSDCKIEIDESFPLCYIPSKESSPESDHLFRHLSILLPQCREPAVRLLRRTSQNNDLNIQYFK